MTTTIDFSVAVEQRVNMLAADAKALSEIMQYAGTRRIDYHPTAHVLRQLTIVKNIIGPILEREYSP